MLYIILLLTVLIIYILIKEPKSLYSSIFSFELFAIILIMFSNIMLTIRMYFATSFIVNNLEYDIYNTFSKIPFTFADIKTLANASLNIFFIASVMLITHDASLKQRRRMLSTAAAVLLCAAMQVLNSPQFLEKLRAMEYSDKRIIAEAVKSGINFVNTAMLSMGIIACVKLFIQSNTTKMFFIKHQLRLLLIFTLIINLIYISIVVLMPIKGMINNYDIYTIHDDSVESITIVICASILLTIMTLFYNLLFSKKTSILERAIFKKPQPIEKKCNLESGNIRHVFHSYKNAFFSIKMLIQKAENAQSKAECTQHLDEAKKQIDDIVKRTGKFLNLYNNSVPIEYNYINVSDCINNALSKTVIADGITVKKDYNFPGAFVYGDYDAITEALVNLFSNASEAIVKKGGDDGVITISTWFEYPWLCISIKDNGTGITRKDRKKIFEPLYSTKQTFNNWGVGLSYVKSIVSEHAGYVNVKSTPGQCSEFQIALPADDIDEVIEK